MNSNLELIKLCRSSTGSKQMSELIRKLIEKGVVNSERICRSMLQIDRGEFTNSSYAYADSY
jgi:hypothetical protein